MSDLWEQIVFDVVTRKFPHLDLMTGIRACDKSQVNKGASLRFEIWITIDEPSNPRVKEIKDFIDNEYAGNNGAFIYKNHKNR
jgi:hypothetical protein